MNHHFFTRYVPEIYFLYPCAVTGVSRYGLLTSAHQLRNALPLPCPLPPSGLAFLWKRHSPSSSPVNHEIFKICCRGRSPGAQGMQAVKSRSHSSAQSHETSANRAPVLPFPRRSLSDPCQPVNLLPIKLVKRRRRDAQKQQAACQTPFQFVQFLSNQSAHSFSSFLS